VSLADKARFPDPEAEQSIIEFHRQDQMDCSPVPFASSPGGVFQACTASREGCLRSLDSVVAQMQGANAALPKVWDAIDAQNDDAERSQHDGLINQRRGGGQTLRFCQEAGVHSDRRFRSASPVPVGPGN
jgi:hypothetical protein